MAFGPSSIDDASSDSFGVDQFPFFGPRDLCVPSTVVLP